MPLTLRSCQVVFMMLRTPMCAPAAPVQSRSQRQNSLADRQVGGAEGRSGSTPMVMASGTRARPPPRLRRSRRRASGRRRGGAASWRRPFHRGRRSGGGRICLRSHGVQTSVAREQAQRGVPAEEGSARRVLRGGKVPAHPPQAHVVLEAGSVAQGEQPGTGHPQRQGSWPSSRGWTRPGRRPRAGSGGGDSQHPFILVGLQPIAVRIGGCLTGLRRQS